MLQRPFVSSINSYIMIKRILFLLLVVITALFNLTGAVGAAIMPADNARPAVQYVDWAADSISQGGSNRKMLASESAGSGNSGGRGRGGFGRGGRGGGRGGRGGGRGGRGGPIVIGLP
jgi:hypothetical protein